ncbi:MAG TPA: acyl-CoA synthetase [Amaricoccus sp.]|uniref:acyl-CoA synthetase n=1 Tax=Amaricoccus sp. TaxID=1872485 RepID=UPI001D4B89A3|nr:acyl-CoA synthetase [Amaricoccus sp.]MCB1374296.1 acyl-CoA synthetase [Paracoccaceae bacterium]MCC0066687.1 acyl-CoA synthetase [Rhodovulum sp.]HPG21741.1 acyl-CoA synthetase [Amaricoccus sp.]HRW14920.1 acyl-CoA synthetase [Amaricoccus sp.]
MFRMATLADKLAVEAEAPVESRWTARTLYEQLCETAGRFPDRQAVAFQLRSGPRDKAVTLSWAELRAEVVQLANLLRSLGLGPGEVVASVLPNGLEAPVTLLAGATAGIVNPINPLLSPEHIAGILRETGAKVVVTLAPFPQSDVAQKVAEAVALAPGVETVLQADLARYLPAPLAWAMPVLRPKAEVHHRARVLDLRSEMQRHPADELRFTEDTSDRVCAYFHTGGTTGLPKIAQHHARGILYNGWCGKAYMFTEADVMMCPLPMFHVLAAYPVFMSCLTSGAQIVFPTPQGFRGAGVLKNFWKLIERYRASFVITVPTAVSALMQRPVDADVSTLRLAISGSAAMPVELFHRFEEATGVMILEGYGLTEATCLIAVNPPYGERKIGSVGLPFAYTDVRILHCDAGGGIVKECGTDEVGEICARNPGVNAAVYTDAEKNRGIIAEGGYLRTGDLGRLDTDGYLWITGRAKDLIIRGGHNIDPAVIEEAMMSHPEVAFAGAIGQPDMHSGEVPAVYVELVEGSRASEEELLAHARARIPERAAVPKHVEVLEALPKTAVGKVFKPDLRCRAIARVLNAALAEAGTEARIAEVVEDRRRGLVARVEPGRSGSADEAVATVLGGFTVPWEWRDGRQP